MKPHTIKELDKIYKEKIVALQKLEYEELVDNVNGFLLNNWKAIKRKGWVSFDLPEPYKCPSCEDVDTMIVEAYERNGIKVKYVAKHDTNGWSRKLELGLL